MPIVSDAQGLWITWPAVPGKTHRVEFKDNLSDSEWQVCSEGVSFLGNQGWLKPSASVTQKFFRVVAL